MSSSEAETQVRKTEGKESVLGDLSPAAVALAVPSPRPGLTCPSVNCGGGTKVSCGLNILGFSGETVQGGGGSHQTDDLRTHH